ncbi:HNH endonuclease signature motif containing protein [[Mycobacterium] wendilense]|uniref:HNH endonuclease signature motif containing protein n=1 Tax=[Mycobacterium] wendilense TaxID=3064284 RepID=A0ABM9MGE1_9MYCO|nr:HNH endonuclease signature motif containing protein [Mycolicibacterium sp. MU0050]CAJ1584553.1 HNH endonuclease signature motif containing protein [Mycolicibacterium sp. MU0050]
MGRDVFGDRQRVLACLDALESAHRTLESCSLDGFSHEELVKILARRETLAWRSPVIDQRILARLTAEANPGEFGAASLTGVLSERLRISRGDAGRRIKEAADLGPRPTLTGDTLAPVLPELAAAQASGRIGPEHIEIARKAYAKIPPAVAEVDRAAAEADLAMLACQFGPAAFQKLADHLVAVLDPDGDYKERERQAKRSVRLGKQGPDGMSTLTATITPELRASLEPVLAKLAAPGMCNPADESPCVKGAPTEAQILADDRTIGQRHHDALQAMTRMVLASGDLGQLNGLPVTVIVTTTLAELTAAAHSVAAAHGAAVAPEPTAGPAAGPAPEGQTEPAPGPENTADADVEDPGESAAVAPELAATLIGTPAPKPLTGKAITAGGTLLPMGDLMRMASHAYHYLTIFDGAGRALWLGRAKRIASADQRIVLHARDRGCTRPGCTVGGYHTQVHHLTEWVRGGATDINNLALTCPADNRMATEQHWTTQLDNSGRVEWIPPPQSQHQQPRTNPYHFIEDLIDYHRSGPAPGVECDDPLERPEPAPRPG